MQSIIEIAEKVGLELTQIGEGMFRAFCPFHNDKNNPNFTLYENTNEAHCFSCGWHGDLIKFVASFYKISKEEAMQKLSFDDEWIKNQLTEQRKNTEIAFVLVYARQIRELLKQHPDRYKEVVKILKGYNNENIIEKYNQIQTMLKRNIDEK